MTGSNKFSGMGADDSPATSGTSQVPPGFHEASWVSKTFFSFVNPLLDAAARNQVDSEDHVDYLQPPCDRAEQLSQQFEAEYQRIKVGLRCKVNSG